MKPPWQIAWPFSMSARTVIASSAKPGPDVRDAHAERLRRRVARVHRRGDALGQRLRVGRRHAPGDAHPRSASSPVAGARARAAATCGSGPRRSARRDCASTSRTVADADRIGPRERPARIVDALLHREVDRRRGGDALHDGVGRLVREHRDDAHHREARDVVEAGDRDAGRLQRADRRRVRGVAAGVGARDRESRRGRVVEREVEEHEVAHAASTPRARSPCVRRSARARRRRVPRRGSRRRETANRRARARRRRRAAAIRSASGAAMPSSPWTVTRAGAGSRALRSRGAASARPGA